MNVKVGVVLPMTKNNVWLKIYQNQILFEKKMFFFQLNILICLVNSQQVLINSYIFWGQNPKSWRRLRFSNKNKRLKRASKIALAGEKKSSTWFSECCWMIFQKSCMNKRRYKLKISWTSSFWNKGFSGQDRYTYYKVENRQKTQAVLDTEIKIHLKLVLKTKKLFEKNLHVNGVKKIVQIGRKKRLKALKLWVLYC